MMTTIAGRLSIPVLVNLLGDGLFDHPFDSLWETLLTFNRPSGNLVNSQWQAWNHIKHNLQSVATSQKLLDNELLLSQDILCAGFYGNSSLAGLMTEAMTIELECLHSRKLDQQILSSLPRNHCKRWAWEDCLPMSGIFLLSLSDQMGYIEDPVFQVAI